ncbi:MAG: magnesium chelatase, partial [Bacteroidota bacterium]
KPLINTHYPKATEAQKLLFMEFILHGLAEFSMIGKHLVESGTQFKDLLSGMFSMSDEEDEDDEWGGYYEEKS